MAFKSYREIVAWQLARRAVKAVYVATAAMPADERFGLTSQMRRASVSVPSNIAEGFGRGTRAELLRSCRTSRGSLFELMTQIDVSRDLGFLQADELLDAQLAEVDRVLQGLIRSMEDAESAGSGG